MTPTNKPDLILTGPMMALIEEQADQLFTVHRLAKAIAGLVVGLQRFDALIFTGGIGENSAVVRSMVLSRLGFLGLTEDVQANADHGRRTAGRVSLDGPVLALVVPTDEELLIARDTARVIAGGRPALANTQGC